MLVKEMTEKEKGKKEKAKKKWYFLPAPQCTIRPFFFQVNINTASTATPPAR